MKPKDAADSLSDGQDKKERTKRNEHIGMQKCANFTIDSPLHFWFRLKHQILQNLINQSLVFQPNS